jgi:hypothetical protein
MNSICRKVELVLILNKQIRIHSIIYKTVHMTKKFSSKFKLLGESKNQV